MFDTLAVGEAITVPLSEKGRIQTAVSRYANKTGRILRCSKRTGRLEVVRVAKRKVVYRLGG